LAESEAIGVRFKKNKKLRGNMDTCHCRGYAGCECDQNQNESSNSNQVCNCSGKNCDCDRDYIQNELNELKMKAKRLEEKLNNEEKRDEQRDNKLMDMQNASNNLKQ